MLGSRDTGILCGHVVRRRVHGGVERFPRVTSNCRRRWPGEFNSFVTSRLHLLFGFMYLFAWCIILIHGTLLFMYYLLRARSHVACSRDVIWFSRFGVGAASRLLAVWLKCTRQRLDRTQPHPCLSHVCTLLANFTPTSPDNVPSSEAYVLSQGKLFVASLEIPAMRRAVHKFSTNPDDNDTHTIELYQARFVFCRVRIVGARYALPQSSVRDSARACAFQICTRDVCCSAVCRAHATSDLPPRERVAS